MTLSRSNRHKISRSHKKSHRRFSTKNCPPETGFDVVEFLVHAFSKASSSFVSTLTQDIRAATGTANLEALACYEMMSNKFTEATTELQAQILAKVQESQSNVKTVMTHLGLKAEERTLLQANLNNPKALCKANVQILTRGRNDAKNWTEKTAKVVKRIDEAIAKSYELPQLERNTRDIFGSDSKKILFDYIKNKINPANPPASIQALLREAKSEINESYVVSQTNIKESEIVNGLSSQCNDLPTVINQEQVCSSSTLATKASAVWKILTWENAKTCLIAVGLGLIIKKALTYLIEKVITILVNIFSLFAVTVLKVVYFAVKVGYYIYQAVRETNMKKKSGFWGDAVGSAVRMLLVIAGVDRRRKMK